MNSPLLSIIIPIYKPDEIILHVLDSVIETSKLIPIEVVLVFNGPEGNIRQRDIEERVRKNGVDYSAFNNDVADACTARNKGMLEATGDFFKFLDADDILIPVAAARQFRIMKETRIDVLTGDHFVRIGDSEKLKPRQYRTPLQAMVSGEIGITSSAMFRRTGIQQNQWPNGQRINEEKEFYWRLFTCDCSFSHDNEPVFIKTENPHSLSAEAAQSNKMHEVIARYRLKIYRAAFRKSSPGEQQAISEACAESYYRLMNSSSITLTIVATKLLIIGAVKWRYLTTSHRVTAVALSPFLSPMTLGLIKKLKRTFQQVNVT